MTGREYARNRVRSAVPGGMRGGYATERAFVNENLLLWRDGRAILAGDRLAAAATAWRTRAGTSPGPARHPRH